MLNKQKLSTLPETNSNFATENRPGPKRKRSYSNHPFLGAFAVSFREGTLFARLKFALETQPAAGNISTQLRDVKRLAIQKKAAVFFNPGKGCLWGIQSRSHGV